MLRNRGEGRLLFRCLVCIHDLAPVLLAFLFKRCSKFAIASLTLSCAVPPGTFFDESAASRLTLFEKSPSNARQTFLSASSGNLLQEMCCFAPSRTTLPP